MKKKIITFDLSSPSDCRAYLKQFRFAGGRQPTYVVFEDGRRIEFATMSDDQALSIASQFYEMELMARGYQ